jgi:glycosyltransferase involved in cell wall biosynthesis
MRRPTVVQFSLSPTLGGAEVYSAFFSRALEARGWPTRVVVNGAARFWGDLDFGGVERSPFNAGSAQLDPGDIALIHSSLPNPVLAQLSRHFVVALAHQALYDHARPGYYERADLLLAVSRHVAETLQRRGLRQVHPTPLYGVAELERGSAQGTLVAGLLFDADARKPRDRVVAALSRARQAVIAPRRYTPRAGLTLGIVSRIAPLKQFPLLFGCLTPILVRHPRVNLEIFGSAVGHKSLAALRDVLAPLGPRVRYWGHQRDVASAYRTLDYLLTGLPEREALGLNAIESCRAGTPVLAIAAPPFSETMKDGVTGFLYTDPRRDGGADFERVLTGVERGELQPDRDAAKAYLDAFSLPRFADRLDTIMANVACAAAAQHTFPV